MFFHDFKLSVTQEAAGGPAVSLACSSPRRALPHSAWLEAGDSCGPWGVTEAQRSLRTSPGVHRMGKASRGSPVRSSTGSVQPGGD